MTNYLDPRNDLAFKRVFGQRKHLCISLINSMLPFENPIVSIEYQTGELIPELANVLRNTIVDEAASPLDENRRPLTITKIHKSKKIYSRKNKHKNKQNA